MKFLLDANFLMIPGALKIDVLRELQKFGKPELYTLDLVARELESLSQGQGRDARAARFALELVKSRNIRILKSQETAADKELLRIAKGFVVCTQDSALRKRLRARKIHVVYLRQGKYLEKV